MSRLKKSAAGAAIAVTLIGGFEGLRQNAYPDPATKGVPWTICYGHTEGVRPGDRKSLEECKALLLTDLEQYADRVEACVKRPMSIETEVAFLSLAFNIGSRAFCKSRVVAHYNFGNEQGACDAMLAYNRAAGIVFPGLTRRRTAERRLCLKGIAT